MNMEEFNRSLTDLKKHRTIKECFHHEKDECKGKIKQAHSIQKNGKLSILESNVNKNKSLYTFTNFISSENSIIEELVPLGKDEASTFFGFCDYHDTTLFSEVENNKFDFENPKQKLILNKSSYKPNDSIYGYVEFEKIEYNNFGNIIPHKGKGYFRGKIEDYK